MKPPLALLLFLCACQAKDKLQVDSKSIEPDSLIVQIDLNEELAGSAYRQRATGYQLVVKGDSSIYIPAFTESKDNGRVSLLLGLHPLLTYQEQMKQLRVLLPIAAKDYNLDSLKGVHIGRLVQTGNLAIRVTQEYIAANNGYGSTATSEYRKIADFLSQSKLGQDMNELFSPYGLEVVGTSVEKVFFTTMHESIKIDSTKYIGSEIPDQILDAMVWVELGNKK